MFQGHHVYKGSWSWWRYRFDLSEECVFTDERVFLSDMTIRVLGDAVKIGSAMLVSGSEWRLLEEVAQTLGGEGERAEASDVAERGPRLGSELLVKNPWLVGILGGSPPTQAHLRERRRAGTDDADMGRVEEAAGIDVEAEVIEAALVDDGDVFEEARRRRGAWKAEHGLPVVLRFPCS